MREPSAFARLHQISRMCEMSGFGPQVCRDTMAGVVTLLFRNNFPIDIVNSKPVGFYAETSCILSCPEEP
jgi:hypothetical protein